MIKRNQRLKHLFVALAVIAPALFFGTPAVTSAEAPKKSYFFDLHEVVVLKAKLAGLINGLLSPTSWPLRTIASSIVNLSCNQIRAIGNVIRDNKLTADLIVVARKEGNPYLISLILTVDTWVKPVAGMAELLKELRAKGHSLIICSNISSEALEILKVNHKELFDLFEGEPQICSADNRHANGKIIAKPDVEFYQQCGAKNNVGLQDVIFVDDQKKNTDAAIVAGIKNSIQFKNVTQLRHDLALIA